MGLERGVGGAEITIVVGHVGPDRLWAEWLCEQIEQCGATALPWSMEPRTDLATAAREMVAAPARLLLVISDSLVRAGGRSTGQWAELVATLRDELPGRLSTISVGARRPAFLSPRECPLLGILDETAARDEVARHLRLGPAPTGRPATVPWPLRQPRLWRQPFPARNPHFTGREAELLDLRNRLAGDISAVVTVAVHGPAGVGKTQLAIEYAYRFAACYDLVWYVRSEQPATVRADLAGLAAAAGLRISDDLGVTADTVLEALSQGTPAANWLLIFDSAPGPQELARLLPGGRSRGVGHVLVTSLHSGWEASAELLELDVFRRAESVHFLQRRAPRLTEDDGVELADRFGDLPLALDATASYLAASQLPVGDYLRECEQRMTTLLSQAEVSSYDRQVVMAWVLPMNRLREESPAAAQLLRLCAFLAPEPVPMSLLLGSPDGVPPAMTLPLPLGDEIGDAVSRARIFTEIGTYALAKVGQREGREFLQLHRVFQQFLREQLSPDERRAYAEAGRRLLVAADPGQPDLISNRGRYNDLLLHLDAADVTSAASDPAVRQLVINMAKYLFSRGEYTACRSFGENARASWLTVLPPSHPDLVALSVTLANALRGRGDHQRARELDEANLAHARAELGAAHPDTLGAANGLAADLRRLGDWQTAYDIDRQTFETAQAALGPEHHRALLSTHNFAVSRRMMGEFREALALDEATLRRYRIKFAGEENRSTLLSANNVARDLRECGEYARARELQEGVYQRYRELFGEDHPDSLRAMKNLAVSRRKAGDYLAAYELARLCLRRHQRRFGHDHPETLASTTNLANDLRSLGEEAGARARAEEALERLRATAGEDHPYTLCAAVNFAICLRRTGEPEQARHLNQQTRAALSVSLRPTHPYTLACATNLASDLQAVGKVAQARRLGEEVLEQLREVRGADHPYTLACAANLAADRRADGDQQGARELLRETLSSFEARLGPTHPETSAAAGQVRLECDTEPPPT